MQHAGSTIADRSAPGATNRKDVVHFYNTRDVLARCAPNDPGDKVSCWPVAENSLNENKRQLGNLGVSEREEDAVVAFLKTLSDGYMKEPKPAVAGQASTNEHPHAAISRKP
ncbi:MAG: cytochrome c [Rhodospirillales bacterium]|nr:cytochrome c [Rhodospirillales bacterium]